MKLGCFLLPALVFGCASRTVPCAGTGSCPRGRECLASRCVYSGGAPVPSGTRRLLLRPAAIGIARSQAAHGVAPSITLGRRTDEKAALYVRFDPAWSRGKVVSAFLLLDPRAGVPAGTDVDLEVWRARRSFASESFAWSTQPGFLPPFARGIGRAATNTPVRIDVTELLQFFSAHPTQDHGFLVRATSSGETGITLATGVDGGLPPRLDVYVE